MTPTLPTSSKNKDNKHKACVVNGSSQRSMQKNKIKKEILRQILLTLPAAGQARDSQTSGGARAQGGGWPAPALRASSVPRCRGCGRAARRRGYTNTPKAVCSSTCMYTACMYTGRLLLLGGDHQLHLGKLDADLRPTVVAGRGGQSGLLRGQGHSAPL